MVGRRRWCFWNLKYYKNILYLNVKLKKKNKFHAVSCTQRSRQQDPSVKTLRCRVSVRRRRNLTLNEEMIPLTGNRIHNYDYSQKSESQLRVTRACIIWNLIEIFNNIHIVHCSFFSFENNNIYINHFIKCYVVYKYS